MANSNDFIKRVCSFYVSKWHLITMLIPYLKEELNHCEKVTTVLEKELEENMRTLLEKLILNEKDKEKLLKINWKESKELDDKKILDIIKDRSIVIIAGKREYIEKINSYINNIKRNITIINCYEITELNENVTEIIKEYEYILNTSGEKRVVDTLGEHAS